MASQLEELGIQKGEKFIVLRIHRDNNGSITDIQNLSLRNNETLKSVGYNGYMVVRGDELIEYIELENLLVAKVHE